MSNLDNITNKIKADAQQKADEIIQSYEHEINKVKAEYETKSKDLGESIISKAVGSSIPFTVVKVTLFETAAANSGVAMFAIAP